MLSVRRKLERIALCQGLLLNGTSPDYFILFYGEYFQ
jgi:hypothetical protein